MKKSQSTILIGMVFLLTWLVSSEVMSAEKIPQTVLDHAHSVIAPMGSDPVIVNAVKAENRKGKTMADIQNRHRKRINKKGNLLDIQLHLHHRKSCQLSVFSYQLSATE
jgi:hypothetical protein